jgi:hypothetical protein
MQNNQLKTLTLKHIDDYENIKVCTRKALKFKSNNYFIVLHFFFCKGIENPVGGLMGSNYPMVCGGFNFETTQDCFALDNRKGILCL